MRAEGPYCPLPQECPAGHVHVVYPASRMLVQDAVLGLREATDAEMATLGAQYYAALRRACWTPRQP